MTTPALQARLREYAEENCAFKRVVIEPYDLLLEAAVELDRMEAFERDSRMCGAARAEEIASAITCLRDIAAMGKKAGSETAKHWLQQRGYPLEEGGYVPGQGFRDTPEVDMPCQMKGDGR